MKRKNLIKKMISGHLNDFNIEKINTFKALVENYKEEVALKYLQKTNWDETVIKLIKIFL